MNSIQQSALANRWETSLNIGGVIGTSSEVGFSMMSLFGPLHAFEDLPFFWISLPIDHNGLVWMC